ncbi:lanthionine synthetase [Actinomadura graeca]|uniref:Lanthionine synthetase n=1 Tax=Actinomadura graeca TaxID=2750812 RepID=A0ABX8QZZ5_9ACTN|nr:lanthionine synthetase LanC family protein [Actinomadura graeca]QXJ23764.1 lanthionine synthetase [Actinomadura graeca]
MTSQIVASIADRLTDPETVAAVTTRPENELTLPSGALRQWEPNGLSDAFPAVSLLFSELAAADPARRVHAHAHLSAALAAEAPPPVPALYGGSVALAFAAHAAATASGGYGTLLSRLDEAIAGQALRWTRARRARLDAGDPVGDWGGYDVITGGSGFGRYLLARQERTGAEATGEALRETLGLLVRLALAGDVTVGGRKLPVWWVRHDMTRGHADGGHLNLGLAHGVGGPLALLALAWRAGVRVDGQDEAAAAIVALLDAHRLDDDAGPYWPHETTLDEHGHGHERGHGHGHGHAHRGRTRDAWCYGAAGMGRALFLAGAAFEEKEWRETGDAAVRGAFATSGEHSIHDSTLCHGWAGLLHIASRMGHDTGDPVHASAAGRFAGRLRESYDPDAAFGFRYTHPAAARVTDRPGFLEGAAGAALALHCHETGAPPATGWDAALLLA